MQGKIRRLIKIRPQFPLVRLVKRKKILKRYELKQISFQSVTHLYATNAEVCYYDIFIFVLLRSCCCCLLFAVHMRWLAIIWQLDVCIECKQSDHNCGTQHYTYWIGWWCTITVVIIACADNLTTTETGTIVAPTLVTWIIPSTLADNTRLSWHCNWGEKRP